MVRGASRMSESNPPRKMLLQLEDNHRYCRDRENQHAVQKAHRFCAEQLLHDGPVGKDKLGQDHHYQRDENRLRPQCAAPGEGGHMHIADGEGNDLKHTIYSLPSCERLRLCPLPRA